MKILLIQDEGIKIDLERSSNILNDLCNTVKFESYKSRINGELPSYPTVRKTSYINLKEEAELLSQTTSDIEKDYLLYVTNRRHRDNYFTHESGNVIICSFFGWEYYTSLPIENGLFYFIADCLALQILEDFRHQKLTGCIYDFLGDKTGVDMGMKMAHICSDCLDEIRNNEGKSEVLSGILSDLIGILNLISNTSKWGKSVFEIVKGDSFANLNWSSFEDEVAQLYRKLGASVKQNVNLSGFQIDIYLEEETPSKQKIRTVVECKFYKSKVGNRIINDFYKVFHTLKEAGLADRGIVVSSSGFTQDAFLVSKTTGVELLPFEELEVRASSGGLPKREEIRSEKFIIRKKESQAGKRKEKSPKIFVIIPFSPDLDDTYYLGIHEIARILSCSCERVDEIEFVGSILEKIYNSIANSRIIIAEVSSPNPNVYYELGYAHGLNKPVILIANSMSSVPFDLHGYNHIIYRNIVDLREKLKKRLEVLLEETT